MITAISVCLFQKDIAAFTFCFLLNSTDRFILFVPPCLLSDPFLLFHDINCRAPVSRLRCCFVLPFSAGMNSFAVFSLFVSPGTDTIGRGRVSLFLVCT